MLYSLMSHNWSGLILAGLVGFLGWLLVWGGRKLKAKNRYFGWLRFPGYFVCGLASLMVIGSIVAIVRIGSADSQYPAPGKLVDVGGYRMHIMANGDARSQPTVVWLPGAHSQGLTMYHLHKTWRTIGRSILVDRPGTGWSDTGPFPRTTAREAEELATLLEKAGEKGPFVLVGHSYGGLLAANFARRYPDRVAAVVLLDSPTPDTLSTTFTGDDLTAQLGMLFKGLGLSKLMGFQPDLYDVLASQGSVIAKSVQTIETQLSDVRPMMRSRDAHPRSDFTTASIFSEFGPANFRQHGTDFTVYEGELGDLPVFVAVRPADTKDVEQLKIDPAVKRRMLAFTERAKLRYLRISSRSRFFIAPPGSTHNFPFEHPDFVLAVVRQALSPLSPSASPSEK